MGECELVLPRLHKGQLKVVEKAKRFNVLAMGRRYGKTTLFADLLLADENYGALYGHKVAWYAGNSAIFDEVWNLVLELLPPEMVKKKDSKHNRIFLKEYNGRSGSIDFWSLHNQDNNGAGRGRKYRRIVIDEAALVRNLKKLWSRTILPTLTDYMGDAWFGSTPRGINNDFYLLYNRGVEGGKDQRKNWVSWRMPSHENPHLSRDALKELADEYVGLPLDYRQEILAEFVEDAGEIFDLNWINELPLPKNWYPYVYQAWDLAGTDAEEDKDGCESVGVAFTKDWLGRWWLLDMVFGEWHTGQLCEEILRFGYKYKGQIRKIWLEDPVAKYIEHFLRTRQQEMGRHLPIERICVVGRGNKVARAKAGVVPVMANGSFYCDPSASWYKKLRIYLSGFPTTGKDAVDALSLGLTEAQPIALESPAPIQTPMVRGANAVNWDDLTPKETMRRRR